MFETIGQLYEWAWCRDIDYSQVSDMAKEYGLVAHKEEYINFANRRHEEMEAWFAVRYSENDNGEFTGDFDADA